MDARIDRNQASQLNSPAPQSARQADAKGSASRSAGAGAKSVTRRSFSFSSSLFNLDFSWQRTELESDTVQPASHPDRLPEHLGRSGDDQRQKFHKREKLQSLLALDAVAPAGRVKLGEAAYMAWPLMPEPISKT